MKHSNGGALRNGICWLFGELGVKSRKVKNALVKTVKLFQEGKHKNAWAWWETAFALEKLHFFGRSVASKGKEPIKFLIQHLPSRCNLHSAIDHLREVMQANDRQTATVDHTDYVVIVRDRKKVDPLKLYQEILSTIEFGSDVFNRRLYYAVWLCGHLGIAASVNRVILASRHDSGSVRGCACEALGKIGIASPEVTQALASRLADGYYRARAHAAESLIQLRATAAVRSLEEQIQREEVPDVRRIMERALCRLVKDSRRKNPLNK